MLSFPKAFLLSLAVVTLDDFFQNLQSVETQSLKSLSLFEQSVEFSFFFFLILLEDDFKVTAQN